MSKTLKNPEEVDKLVQQIQNQTNYPQEIPGCDFGTPNGVFNGGVRENQLKAGTVLEVSDPVTNLLEDVSDTACGSLGGVGDLVTGSTMLVANDIASGKTNTNGQLSHSILGDTSEVLAKAMIRQYGEVVPELKPRAGVSASASISVTVDASPICAAAQA